MRAFIAFSPDGKDELKGSWTTPSSYLCEDGATCGPATRHSGLDAFHECKRFGS